MTKTRNILIVIFIFLGWVHLLGQKKENSEISISNKYLSVKIATLGAELQSIKAKNIEYLWQGDSIFWKRRSPILFPFVGRLQNSSYTLNNKSYKMDIHGFAKDCIFEVVNQNDSALWLKLKESSKTMDIYPFRFDLIIGYILDKNKIKVIFNVKNNSEMVMPFQVGGHPGFLYPNFNKESECHGYLNFETINKNLYFIVKDKGSFRHINPTKHLLSLNNEGYLPITSDLFKEDALIFENYQARKVTIFDKTKTPYVSVEFDMPIFALWSSPGKASPFICIEPWWGRGEGLESLDIRKRHWTQKTAPNENFITSYTIEIH